MTLVFLLRLAFDVTAAGLLLVGLAYYWLGNTVHELVGTGMFLLIIVHNVFNRRWYGTISRGRREAQGMINIAVTLALLVAMLALLITSVMISNTLFSLLSLNGGFTARQIHTLAAYWALIIVAVHLGLRWPMIMGVARSLFGIITRSALRTLMLRVIAVAIAIQGLRSSFELDVGTKLSMQLTLDWWSFEESVAGFFLHCTAIAGLYISLTYYAMKWIQSRRHRTALGGAVAEGVNQ